MLYTIGVKKIYRSRADRKIAGICGGIGEIVNIDPTLIRLMLVFLCLATALVPVIVTYVVGWVIIPEKPDDNISGIR